MRGPHVSLESELPAVGTEISTDEAKILMGGSFNQYPDVRFFFRQSKPVLRRRPIVADEAVIQTASLRRRQVRLEDGSLEVRWLRMS